ncbi:MAG TPA: FoF1 ATP synthase subunit a [Candidatus Gracilibacteria bacterium]|nr:FoF1 ATP synthase subunit a [Candidatus Gracilibacteria bacterium]
MSLQDLEVHLAPKTLFEIVPGLPVTNTIVTMWIVMAILVCLALVIRVRMRYLPAGFQNFVEWSLGGFYDFMEGIGGPAIKKHFPIFITFFLAILFSNWLGLAMGVVAEGLNLRAPTSDLNTTAALAIVAFLFFEYQGVKAHGLLGYLGHFFDFKAFKKGPVGIIFFFVGLLHIVSELVRPLALSLRLFGNIFGGEIVLVVAFLIVAPLIPLPFMLLEVIVGLIQAFVFAFLFLIFTTLNSSHAEEEH